MEIETLGFGEELEKDIVSLCLHDVQFFLDIREYLKPAHFMSEQMSKTYKVLQAFFDVEHTVPKESILRFLLKNNGLDLPENFLNKDVLNRDFLLKQTVSLVRHQELKRFIFSAANEVDKKDPDFGKLEEDLRKVLNIEPTHNLGTFYFDVDERFARLKALKGERLSTGIPSVDRALQGGLGRKELTCFAAPPGGSKSLLLVISGAYMLRKKHNVLHYTLEMSEELTSLRYDCALLNMTGEEVLGDTEAAKEKIMAYKKVMEENLVIKEFPTKGASVNTFRSHLNKLKEQRRFVPDVIVVDYGDIMKATKAYNGRYEEQGAIFQELRGLAQEMNIPILSATQTNRGAMGKDIATMEDLGDSFDKARIMDALFMILQKPEEKEDGLFRLYNAKVRNGRAGNMYGYEISYANVQVKEVGEVGTITKSED